MTPNLRTSFIVAALGLSLSGAGCFKQKNTPIEQIPQLTTLDDVMDNQATTADPLFKKMNKASFSDAEFAAFVDGAARVDATSGKVKSFSKGPGFDALADQLNAHAKELGEAGRAKDAGKSAQALKDMKATCKECHSKFR